jgi:hypothetical protein
MRSRLLIGAAAWVLGAVTATGGSLLAVNGLAHGLLGQGTQQLTQATVQGGLAGYHAPTSQPARGTGAAVGDDGDDAETGTSRQQPGVHAMQQATPSRPNSGSGGSMLVSSGGTVMASCQSGKAYLQYWSPDQGYRADDVIRGPALQASVGFERFKSEVEIRVTCNGSHPVAHLSNDSSGGWGY